MSVRTEKGMASYTSSLPDLLQNTASGAEKLFQECLWSRDTDGVYHSRMVLCEYEKGVPLREADRRERLSYCSEEWARRMARTRPPCAAEMEFGASKAQGAKRL
jgi:hypothetical protein